MIRFKCFDDRITAAVDYHYHSSEIKILSLVFQLNQLRIYMYSFPIAFYRLSMLWIITGVILYCTSLITADLASKSTQRITKVTTSSPIKNNKKQKLFECIGDECNPRLLSNVEVHSYELEYIYNTTNDTTVQGHVTINFTLKQPTNQLIYHAKRMVELKEPLLYEDGINRLVKMRKYPPHDYISLRLASNDSLFTPGEYRLQQKFVVSLIDGYVGFYQSIYNDGNGTRGYDEIFGITI